MNKPPVGLKPRSIHDEDRWFEVFFALFRYALAKHDPPPEWEEELNEIQKKYDYLPIIKWKNDPNAY